MWVVVPHDRFRVAPWQERAGSRIRVLADPGFEVSCKFGVAFQMRIHTDTSNTPGSFVISKGGEVTWMKIGEGRGNFRDRPKLEEILGALDEAGS